MDYALFAKALAAFFAIMNPFVNLPIFLAMTDGFTVAEQRKLVLRLAVFALIMCGAILVAGQQIIAAFGISVDDFRIAGGLVLMHIAWSMLNGGSFASHSGTDKEREHMSQLNSLAFYPLTFPIIVGPGTIATIIVYTAHSETLATLVTLGAVLAVVILVLSAVLFFASFFGKVLSDSMRVITTRLMGMILLAIAVDMLVAGLRAVFPGLA